MESVGKSLTEAERTREKSVNAMMMGHRNGDEAGEPGDLIMSARLEDLKFMFTLSVVVLFGSGLDIILR
jgi:hypothetical protein